VRYSRNNMIRENTKRRRYRLGRRGERASATRRRIVEATIGLHDDQGITHTTFRDVASRAGVAPATVLRHFPRMDQLIQACGALFAELAPFPTADVLAGSSSASERVRLATSAVFRWYELVGKGMDHLQVDRRNLPEVDAWLREVDNQRRALMAASLGLPIADEDVAIVTALTSLGAWQSLASAGMDTDRAARSVARLVTGSSRRRETH
jgi:AcrR family transcriptional regulator